MDIETLLCRSGCRGETPPHTEHTNSISLPLEGRRKSLRNPGEFRRNLRQAGAPDVSPSCARPAQRGARPESRGERGGPRRALRQEHERRVHVVVAGRDRDLVHVTCRATEPAVVRAADVDRNGGVGRGRRRRLVGERSAGASPSSRRRTRSTPRGRPRRSPAGRSGRADRCRRCRTSPTGSRP